MGVSKNIKKKSKLVKQYKKKEHVSFYFILMLSN